MLPKREREHLARSSKRSKTQQSPRTAKEQETETASATAANSEGNTTTNDVEIERENSAWDALGEKFQTAASQGRYLDLTNDDGDDGAEAYPQQLSPSKARRDFEQIPPPVDPRSLVHHERQSSRRNTECPHPHLQELWDLISSSIESLQEARVVLTQKSDISEALLRRKLNGINASVSRISKFVERRERSVADSPVACRRIEELNLLVHKANIFINEYNTRYRQAGSSCWRCKCGAACHSMAALDRHIRFGIRAGDRRHGHLD